MISNTLFENYIFQQYVGHALNVNECVCVYECVSVGGGVQIKKGVRVKRKLLHTYVLSLCVCVLRRETPLIQWEVAEISFQFQFFLACLT